jgi:uncharacterized protein with FMN-binding domain
MKKLLLTISIIVLLGLYSLLGRQAESASSTTTATSASPSTDRTTTQPTTVDNNTSTPSTAATPASTYLDGEYTGDAANAYYGDVRVKATIIDGVLADIEVLDYPDRDRTSQRINDDVLPELKQAAIESQSAEIDVISGATLKSKAFITSLTSALDQAAV